jgi:peptide/nickel transport system permease protein
MMIPVVLGVITIVFIINALTPGDPARQMMGVSATDAQVEAMREQMGLNKPILVRYVIYLKDLVIKGDMGTSYVTKQPVSREIAVRFPTTFKLALYSMVLSVVIGLPTGIISAIRRYSWIDTVSMSAALIGVSIPNFWFGLLLIMVFAVKLGWLPAVGIKTAAAWIMPTIALSVSSIAQIARTTRSSMLEAMNMDYIRTARAKGQNERVVVMRHMLSNAIIPVITICGLMFGITLGGAVLVESVFAIPGLGKYMVDAIMANNYPAVQGSVLYLSVIFSLVNLVMDILYAFADPRIMATFKEDSIRKRIGKSLKRQLHANA